MKIFASLTTILVASHGSINEQRFLAAKRARILDTSQECLDAQQALSDDPTFNATETVYWENWSNATNSVDMKDTEMCKDEVDNTIRCTVPDNTPGKDEFRTACEEEGGHFQPGSIDFSCTIVQGDVTANIIYDLPPIYFCIPKECDIDSVSKQIDGAQGEIVELYEFVFATIFASSGGEVTCDAVGSSSGMSPSPSVLPAILVSSLLAIGLVFYS